MKQKHGQLEIRTTGAGLIEITGEVRRWLAGTDIISGLLTLFCRHTSCSLLVQENADPDVRIDLEAFFTRLAPEGRWLHSRRGGT